MTLREMWPVVVKAYQKKGKTFTDALLAARMTRILRHGDYNIRRAEANPVASFAGTRTVRGRCKCLMTDWPDITLS